MFSSRAAAASRTGGDNREAVMAGWHSSLDEGLATAEREHKPVLIDIWASWCKNCLTMDQTTLQDSGVKAALDGYVKIKFQADQPEAEAVKPVMQRFHVVGLPAYVILKPKADGNPGGHP